MFGSRLTLAALIVGSVEFVRSTGISKGSVDNCPSTVDWSRQSTPRVRAIALEIKILIIDACLRIDIWVITFLDS